MKSSEPATQPARNGLLLRVEEQFRFFKREGKKHRVLFRSLWISSTVVSLLVAFFTNFSFSIGKVTSADVAAALAILLPVISGYIVMRSPEQLWIHEISTRNRLSDLKTRLELALERDPEFDSSKYDEEYFSIMAAASDKWVALKSRGN